MSKRIFKHAEFNKIAVSLYVLMSRKDGDALLLEVCTRHPDTFKPCSLAPYKELIVEGSNLEGVVNRELCLLTRLPPHHDGHVFASHLNKTMKHFSSA